VAAYMILFGHVKRDISRIGDTQCLLVQSHTNKYLVCTNDEGTLHGCYLYECSINLNWVRDGKATGKGGCVGRNDTHKKKAEADRNDDNSLFYDTFPSRLSSRANSSAAQGVFEDLVQFVAAGYSPNESVQNISMIDYSAGGVFFYTDFESFKIKGTNFKSCTSDGQRFMEMVAYLFELGYDLAQSTSCNTSESPGFEGYGLNLLKFSLLAAGAPRGCSFICFILECALML